MHAHTLRTQLRNIDDHKKLVSKIPANMGSGSSRETQEETCSLEQTTVAPAFGQGNGKADQPKGTTGHESEMQNEADEKVDSRSLHMQMSSQGF